jgi:hypothetical protein
MGFSTADSLAIRLGLEERPMTGRFAAPEPTKAQTNPERLAMAEILNLNQARKAKARADAKTQAAENRAKFGRTKGDKTLDAARAEKLKRDLDGAKREE